MLRGYESIEPTSDTRESQGLDPSTTLRRLSGSKRGDPTEPQSFAPPEETGAQAPRREPNQPRDFVVPRLQGARPKVSTPSRKIVFAAMSAAIEWLFRRTELIFGAGERPANRSRTVPHDPSFFGFRMVVAEKMQRSMHGEQLELRIE